MPGAGPFAFLFLTVLLDMLALGVVIPILPSLVTSLSQAGIAETARITGWFGFISAAMQFLFAPVLGALSDRFGRRPILLLSNLGLGLDYALMAFAPSVPWLFVGKLVSGITSANQSTAAAYLADITEPGQRVHRYSALTAAFGIGFMIGPALGGFLGRVDLRLPFLVAAALCLLNAAFGFLVLPESLPAHQRKWRGLRSLTPLSSLSLLVSKTEVRILAGILFLHFIAHEALMSVFVLYTGHRYGWREQETGLAIGALSLISTAFALVAVKPIVKRVGSIRALRSGLFFGALGFVFFGLAPTGLLFAASIPIFCLAWLAGPVESALISESVEADEQGKLQGALSAMRAVCAMIGPLLFTQIFAVAVSRPAANGLASGLPYLLAGACFAGALLASLLLAPIPIGAKVALPQSRHTKRLMQEGI